MDMSQLNVAVIGLGRMGRRHMQVAQKLGMNVVGACDRLPESIEVAREEFGLRDEVLFRDPAEMLERVSVDAVIVATTAPSHAELVLRAANANARYILCEKPIATSLEEAESMIGVCAKAKCALAVNHQMRFMPQYTVVKEMIEQPEFGGLVSILVAGSNFGLAMNASHYFEMFRFMTGEEVASVEAWLDPEKVPNPRGEIFEDRAGRVRATNASGVAMYIDCSARAGHGLNVMYVCRYGQIYVDELTGFLRVSRRKEEFRSLPTTRYGMPSVDEIKQIEAADVIAPTEAVWRAMLSGEPFPDGRTGLHAIRCLAAAHASDELGTEVQLDSARLARNRVFPWA